MPSDLDVTSASWGTQNMKLSTEEVYPQTTQQQMAENTGYNFYRPQRLVDDVDVTSTTNTTYIWSHAGTYTGEATGTYDADGGWGDADGWIKINGTKIWDIVGHDGADPAVTGEESVTGVILPDGRIAVEVYAEDQGASYDSYWTNVHVRIRQTS